ncbi:hypothetical protein EMCRGX_G018979 [Ephydatia muelleri]
MSTRAEKSGINAEVQQKLAATYSLEDEAKARGWLEAIVGESIGQDFWDGLKDGSYLCKVLNKLQPNLVPAKYELPSSQPFKQIEAVGKFLDGCKNYGMSEKDLCVTLDIQEKNNPNMGLATIIALGRQAQKNGYTGPALGPKEAQPCPHEIDEQRIREGRNVIGLQMGTNKGASQAGMTPYGHQRQINAP